MRNVLGLQGSCAHSDPDRRRGPVRSRRVPPTGPRVSPRAIALGSFVQQKHGPGYTHTFEFSSSHMKKEKENIKTSLKIYLISSNIPTRFSFQHVIDTRTYA